MKLECFLTPYTKINSKWIKDLNVRPEIIKLLEEKYRQDTLWHKSKQDSLWPYPRVMEAKINKWNSIKLKSFCTAKASINKAKRPPTEWEKKQQTKQLTDN